MIDDLRLTIYDLRLILGSWLLVLGSWILDLVPTGARRWLVALLTGASLATAQAGYSGLESWYQVETLSLAGAGAAFSSAASDRLNPAALWSLPRQFHLGLVQYPAAIGAESVTLIFPNGRGAYAFSLRHLGYGVFNGYDVDGNPTENYTSDETWVTLAVGRPLSTQRIVWGLSLGLFASRLETYQSLVLTATPGVLIRIDEIDSRIGLSVQNAGRVLRRYTRYREPLPTTVTVAVAKRLAHLPLEISLDGGYRLEDEHTWFRLGGVFQLPYHLQLRWGTGTDKFDQRTQTNLARDFLGSSGIGISYTAAEYHLDLGIYLYGTGGWASGLGFGVRF
jgi:hypothetical protein